MTFPTTGCDLPLTLDFLLFVVGNSKLQYAKMFKYLGQYTSSSRTWLMMSIYSRKSVIGLFIRTNILCRKFHNSSTHVKIPLLNHMLFVTGSIARSAKRRYLSYSETDFDVFRPARATRCTDWVKFGMDLHADFHSHRCNDKGVGPPKLTFLLKF